MVISYLLSNTSALIPRNLVHYFRLTTSENSNVMGKSDKYIMKKIRTAQRS
jgi:hypothetical protein